MNIDGNLAVPIQSIEFINAEPATMITPQGPAPSVVLSFGGAEGPVIDKAVSIQDARDMTMDILRSLATIGDPIAQGVLIVFKRIIEEAQGSGGGFEEPSEWTEDESDN